MNSELQNIKEYFNRRRRLCIRVTKVEKEAEIPAKTLEHFLAGRRLLSAEHLEKLIPVLVDFGYKPLTAQFL